MARGKIFHQVTFFKSIKRNQYVCTYVFLSLEIQLIRYHTTYHSTTYGNIQDHEALITKKNSATRNPHVF